LSFDNILLGLALVGALAALVVIIRRRRAGIGFKTLDEVAVVQQLMFWAADKVPAERRAQFLLGSGLMPRGVVALQSITREELAILAPYIDEWIAGKLPPQNLPAEYEDYRPRVLLGFKQRLQSEGRWPLTTARKRFAGPEKRA
jgi:hypothetical protein